MTSSYPLKRPHSDAVHEDGPFRKKVAYEPPTGLEDSSHNPPSKQAGIAVSGSMKAIYYRRKKTPARAVIIRKAKAMTSQANHSFHAMPVEFQKGLKNPGPLCYRISLLQALLHRPNFVNWVLENHRPEHCVIDNHEECIPCAIRLLIQEYWRGTRSEPSKVFLGMDGLFKFWGWQTDSVIGHADPDEHATWLLGAISKTLPTSSFRSLEALQQLFTTSVIRCDKCHEDTRTPGPGENALRVELTPRIKNGTLSQYLEKGMSETLEYRCERCQHKGQKKRIFLIDSAPDTLVVALKRITPAGHKINDPVAITNTLDLDRYRDPSYTDRLLYDITGVIKHKGDTTSGHYICSIKAPDGKWYEFNDQSVKASSVSDAVSSKDRFTPYILFFQRK